MFLRKSVCAIFLLAVAAAISPAQTFTNLATFDKTNGTDPIGNLIQGLDGNLYGTAEGIGFGAPVVSSVFQVTPAGVLTTFSGVGKLGLEPDAGLVLATNGNFYGTTYWGGDPNVCPHGCGTVFEVTSSGASTTLDTLSLNPNASLLEVKGKLYGTTTYAGSVSRPNCFQGCGTVFAMTLTGTVTVLHDFTGADGRYPQGALTLGRDGNLYGTTYDGGSSYHGAFFKITPTGTLTLLHSFGPGDERPLGAVLGSDGNFYGMSAFGGPNNHGTVFKITPAGVMTRLHTFTGSDGDIPTGTLLQATDGNFYGTTEFGGSNTCQPGTPDPGCGTIFVMTPAGVLTTLHSFDGTDGEFPVSGLLQATDGNLYGTTFGIGAGAGTGCGTSCGTVFKWSTGLAPFVTPLPASGHEGNTIRILGTDLTGATAVTFNGKTAKFTVISPTQIEAIVPMCVKTGPIVVTTPGGKLTSNVVFTAD
jgi:uncharacterized repeat protein (TIGR03803 family)